MRLKLLQLNKGLIKSTFTGKISFSDFSKIATVTSRKVMNDGSSNNFFQRPSDSMKISKISYFIKKRLLNEDGTLKDRGDNVVIFPTAIILSLNKKDENTDIEVELDGDYLEFNEDLYDAFIIDGQHRYLGIKKFYEDNNINIKNTDIEIPVTILVGYDIWEQSKIFAEVNFEQKPVNKSLYYDLFGSLPNERNEYTLSHKLIKHLNYSKKSPFLGLIKMLGVGAGVISQAFLVEKVIKLFKPEKAFSIFYDDYVNGKVDQKILADVILIYFNTIKEKFSDYYPSKNEKEQYSIFNQDILFKTTGIGALLRLLNDFDHEIKIGADNLDHLSNYFNKIFSLINREEAKYFFSKEGSFSGSGSEGLQSKLYNHLKELINYKKDVVGKEHNNAIILDIKISKDHYDRNKHNLTLNNGTTTIVDDERLEKIIESSPI